MQQITHRTEQKHTRNNAQCPLCIRKHTVNLKHTMYDVHHTISNMQCTIYNKQDTVQHCTIYYLL